MIQKKANNTIPTLDFVLVVAMNGAQNASLRPLKWTSVEKVADSFFVSCVVTRRLTFTVDTVVVGIVGPAGFPCIPVINRHES